MSRNQEENYNAVHIWLRYHYGKASICESLDCNGKSNYFTWSLKREKKCVKKRSNFWQLCRSCHANYDINEHSRERMRDSNKNTHKKYCKRGHEFSEGNIYRDKNRNGNYRRVCLICKRTKLKSWVREKRENDPLYLKEKHDYFQEWWEKNKEAINRKRREKTTAIEKLNKKKEE